MISYWRQANFILIRFKCNARNAQAAWLRCLNGTAFASLKKYASHFFNHAFSVTEPKEAPYETTGKSVVLSVCNLSLFRITAIYQNP